MKKRFHLFLNILEFISYTLFLCFTMMNFRFGQLAFIGRFFLLLPMTIFGATYLSINLFLFLVMKDKIKVLNSIYKIVTILILAYVTIQSYRYGFFILLIFHFIQDSFRMYFVDKIYVTKKVKHYSKIFNFCLKEFKKRIISFKKGLFRVLQKNKGKRRIVDHSSRQGAVS